MGKRPLIGIIYSINENWIAGTYYIENLLSALKSLPDADQPFINVYCYDEREYHELISKTKYSYSQPVYIKDVTNFIDRIINFMSFRLFKRHWRNGMSDNSVELIFPNPWSYHFEKIKRKIAWIPDFQEKHYPDFFSSEQIKLRRHSYTELIKSNYEIVFSSQHAKQDFLELYPGAKNKLFVMPFAVTLPDMGRIQWHDLQKRYDLSQTYFICSNQFWAHKNHPIVLSALKIVKKRGYQATVVFTGKPFDNRNPDYYSTLLAQVDKEALTEDVRFLGFIPRDEQLVLMKNAQAIIQPSLFEGWSTVVEDAKALNNCIIVSDIPVHREQLNEHELFFDCYNADQLADMMILVLAQKQKYTLNNTYDINIKQFGRIFMDIVKARL